MPARRTVVFASGHGAIGGGEQMLLRMAEAATDDYDLSVVGPDEPRELALACAARGIPYVGLPAQSRKRYAAQLAWHLAKPRLADLLWCNGALPAACATAARTPYVVHL